MRARLLTAAATIAILALSACGGDDDPPPTSSSTPMPIDPSSESPSTTTGKSSDPASAGDTPTPPPEAMEHTKAGAEAFAVWYLEQAGESKVTGKVDALTKYGTSNCAPCKEVSKSTLSRSKQYGLTDINPYQGVEVERAAKVSDDFYNVLVDYSHPTYYLYKSEKRTARFKEAEYSLDYRVVYSPSEGWRIKDWFVVKGTET